MAKKQETTITPTETHIYIGPTLHQRSLVSGSAFRNGIPAYVDRLIEKIPDLRQLIIPVEDLSVLRVEMHRDGTELNRVYNYLSTVRFNGNGDVINNG